MTLDLKQALPECKVHAAHHYFVCHLYIFKVAEYNNAIEILPLLALAISCLLSHLIQSPPTQSTPQWAWLMPTPPGHLSRHLPLISEPNSWNKIHHQTLYWFHVSPTACCDQERKIFYVFLLYHIILNRTNIHELMSSLVNWIY